jgi:hypothetical protein
MAKGTSFADKSKEKKKISQTFVKYVKSIKSEKTGHWRFNEQMVGLKSGENLDGAIKRLEEESLALDLDLSNMETAVEETVEAQNEAAAEDTPVEDVKSEEEIAAEESREPTSEATPEIEESVAKRNETVEETNKTAADDAKEESEEETT